MKALVIGGGIGGLASALSLAAVGIECVVCESVAGHRRARGSASTSSPTPCAS